jgi:hypothetical protein
MANQEADCYNNNRNAAQCEIANNNTAAELLQIYTGCSIWMAADRVETTSLGMLREYTRQEVIDFLASMQHGFDPAHPVILEAFGAPLVGKSRDDQIAYVVANPTCDQLQFNCVDGAHRVHFLSNRGQQVYAALLFGDDETPLTHDVKVKIAVDLNSCA